MTRHLLHVLRVLHRAIHDWWIPDDRQALKARRDAIRALPKETT